MPKPRSTLALVGPRGHGKTRLAAGLRRASAPVEPGAASVDEAPGERPPPLVATAIESAQRRYTLLDPGERGALTRRVITGPIEGLEPLAGAVLVVDVDATYRSEFKDDLRLLRRVGAAGLVVFMGRSDDADPDYVDLAEHELRLDLADAGCDGDAVPIVRGSLRALVDGGPAGDEVAARLYEALDRHVHDPSDRRARLVVTDVIAADREVEVECSILEPGIEADEAIELVGITATRAARVVALTEVRGEGAGAAPRVRCALRGVAAADLRVGQVLARPGAIAASHRFEAELWLDRPGAPEAAECQVSFHDAVAVSGLARPLKDRGHGYEVELSTALALAPGDPLRVVVDGAPRGVGLVVATRGGPRKRRRGALSPAGVALAFVDSLHRGDRPDVAASVLYPPEEVLRATSPAFAADTRADVRSGRVLLALVEDGRRGDLDHSSYSCFAYNRWGAPPSRVEYVGPREKGPWWSAPTHRARGTTLPVYSDLGDQRHEMRDYRIDAGVTLRWTRFQIQVTRGGVREDLLVSLRVAEFEVKPGTWYLFGFERPYAWQTF
ncbi:MAG: hypothetical protein R3B09_09400 [Nannocystaceae bacterium]